MNRAAQFLRSVLPADLFQLLFLIGLVCLTVAPHLHWWPPDVGPIWRGYYAAIVIATFGFVLASSSGYFLCFWPGERSATKVWVLVVLPAIASTGLIVAKFLSIRRGDYSVIMQTRGPNLNLSWAFREVWHLGNGIHFSLLGIGLAALFGLRLSSGRSHLPLQLRDVAANEDISGMETLGVNRLIWFSVAPASAVLMGILGLVLFSPLLLTSASKKPHEWMSFLQSIVGATVMLATSMWFAGSENRKTVLPLVRFASARLMLVGTVLPVVVTLSPSIAQYIVDRIGWAAQNFGKFAPPQLGGYLPQLQIWTLSLVFGAFAEEVIFRGVLQQFFLRRFGLWRGVLLVGVVWGAFHFFSDKWSYTTSNLEIVLSLCYRIIQCVILGFALSWLTLRSGSLLPAAIAHWLSNVGVYSARTENYPGSEWVRALLWLAVGCVLFRIWPVDQIDRSERAHLAENPELADT